MKEKKVVGIDIGSVWIKIIEITERKVSKETKYAISGFIRGKVEEGKPLFNTIRELINQAGIKTKEAITAAQGQGVEVKFFDIRVKPDKNLEKNIKSIIKFQLSKDGQIDLDQYYMDFSQVAEKDMPDSEKDLKVLALLSKKEIINELYSTLDKADLTPLAIDCVPAAIYNCCTFLRDRSDVMKEDNYAVVNFGINESLVMFVKDNKLFFVRQLQTKGKDILDVVQKRFFSDVDPQQAKSSKLIEDTVIMIVDPKEKTEEFKDVVALKIEELGRDLRSTLEFFESQNEVAINKVYFCGGFSSMYSLNELIKEHLPSREISILNPIQNVDIELDENRKNQLMSNPPQLVVALGLAARMY